MSSIGTVFILELLPELEEEPVPELLEPLPVPADRSRAESLAATEGTETADPDVAVTPRDWYAIAADVAAEMSIEEPTEAVVNPGYEKRRQAAIAWNEGVPKSRKRQIWENVEQDQTGRTLLTHGDCYRVLDDPNVTRYEWQKEFFQYIVTCSKPTGSEARRKFQAILDRYVHRSVE